MALAALIHACVKPQPRGVFTVAGDPERYKDGRGDIQLSLEEHFVEQVNVYNAAVFDNGRENRVLCRDVFDRLFGHFQGTRPRLRIDPLDCGTTGPAVDLRQRAGRAGPVVPADRFAVNRPRAPPGGRRRGDGPAARALECSAGSVHRITRTRSAMRLSIPGGGEEALIVGAVKGFDSTGSKLTAPVREIEEMAAVRLRRQFLLAFVEGIGWLRRRADLRRIYQLWADRAIDGLYSLTRRGEFQQDIAAAARRLGLLE